MRRWSHDGVRQERTGWRCAEISQRHRQWGYNCPCVDMDFLVAEYNHGQPVALIEYKNKHAAPADDCHPTYRALRAIADGYRVRPLPFLIAIYCPEDWWFRVIPLNEAAIKFYGSAARKALTEQQFVRGLYLMRERSLTAADEAAICRLNELLPGQRKRNDEADLFGPRPDL